MVGGVEHVRVFRCPPPSKFRIRLFRCTLILTLSVIVVRHKPALILDMSLDRTLHLLRVKGLHLLLSELQQRRNQLRRRERRWARLDLRDRLCSRRRQERYHTTRECWKSCGLLRICRRISAACPQAACRARTVGVWDRSEWWRGCWWDGGGRRHGGGSIFVIINCAVIGYGGVLPSVIFTVVRRSEREYLSGPGPMVSGVGGPR